MRLRRSDFRTKETMNGELEKARRDLDVLICDAREWTSRQKRAKGLLKDLEPPLRSSNFNISSDWEEECYGARRELENAIRIVAALETKELEAMRMAALETKELEAMRKRDYFLLRP